jgi:hypothetical protein
MKGLPQKTKHQDFSPTVLDLESVFFFSMEASSCLSVPPDRQSHSSSPMAARTTSEMSFISSTSALSDVTTLSLKLSRQ